MANQYTANTFISDTHKQCSKCKEIKEHADFHKCKTHLYGKGLSYYCKACANKNSREHHSRRVKEDESFRLQKKNNYIKSRHGITLQEYKARLAQQQYTCAICRVKLSDGDPNVHLDHCHKTGKLRAFLCTNCNRGLGHFQDSIDNLQSAINYLISHSEYENSQKGNSQC